MKQSHKIGIVFGITSGIITTTGLMVGLSAGTHSRLAVIGGILTIAIADSMSDALGIHLSEESNKKISHREVWEATILTFLTKLIFSSSFIIPILLFSLGTAIIINIAVGLTILSILSYSIAKHKNESPLAAILEHLATAIVVIIATHYLGELIYKYFNTAI